MTILKSQFLKKAWTIVHATLCPFPGLCDLFLYSMAAVNRSHSATCESFAAISRSLAAVCVPCG